MKKFLLSLFLLAGVTFATLSTTAEARSPIVLQPQCYYVVTPVTQYMLVWTGFGYAYTPVVTYVYTLVCR